ncbi:MAG: hypothetical protein HZA90_03280 [Verrucomicrobia bacterium]|nr:hypothetical protein [Verrucomicrobiota bacterium]
MKTVKTQLELGFATPMKLTRMTPHNRRMARARWWFGQMHAVVDRAFDWSATPVPPPEQIYLTLAKAR